MKKYQLTNEMRSVKRLTLIFVGVLFIGGFPLSAPIFIKIAALGSLVIGLTAGVTSFIGEEVILDDDRIHIRVPFKIGLKEISWNEISSINAYYVIPFVAIMEITILKDGKNIKDHIPIADFPPELVVDIVSRLSKDVDVILSPEIRENYNVN